MHHRILCFEVYDATCRRENATATVCRPGHSLRRYSWFRGKTVKLLRGANVAQVGLLASVRIASFAFPFRAGGTVAAESCVDSYSGVPAPASHRLPDSPMPTRHGRLSTAITIAHSACACQAPEAGFPRCVKAGAAPCRYCPIANAAACSFFQSNCLASASASASLMPLNANVASAPRLVLSFLTRPTISAPDLSALV